MIYDLIFSFFEFIFPVDILVTQPYSTLSIIASFVISVLLYFLIVLPIPLIVLRKLYFKRKIK